MANALSVILLIFVYLFSSCFLWEVAQSYHLQNLGHMTRCRLQSTQLSIHRISVMPTQTLLQIWKTSSSNDTFYATSHNKGHWIQKYLWADSFQKAQVPLGNPFSLPWLNKSCYISASPKLRTYAMSWSIAFPYISPFPKIMKLLSSNNLWPLSLCHIRYNFRFIFSLLSCMCCWPLEMFKGLDK